jgi:hypothetical protein
MLSNCQPQAGSWFASSLDKALVKLLLRALGYLDRVFTFKSQSVFTILPSQLKCDRVSSGGLDAVAREE